MAWEHRVATRVTEVQHAKVTGNILKDDYSIEELTLWDPSPTPSPDFRCIGTTYVRFRMVSVLAEIQASAWLVLAAAPGRVRSLKRRLPAPGA